MNEVLKYIVPENFINEYFYENALKYTSLFGNSEIFPFVNGMARVKCYLGEDTGDGFGRGPDEYLYGFINESKKMVIPFLYSEAWDFYEDVAWVRTEYYDSYSRTFKVKNPESVNPDEEIEVVRTYDQLNTKATLIDKTGNTVMDMNVSIFTEFNDGLAYFETHDHKMGYLNTKGEVLEIHCK
ncbi:MAG: WG repeat-containing protein [Bacteroidota bacterium]